MRVKWIENYYLPRNYGECIDNIFKRYDYDTKEYKGEVIHRYTTFFGVPKFIVSLDDGCIVKVRMDMCHTIDEEIDKIKDYLDAIIKDCDKLNSANVSHEPDQPPRLIRHRQAWQARVQQHPGHAAQCRVGGYGSDGAVHHF